MSKKYDGPREYKESFLDRTSEFLENNFRKLFIGSLALIVAGGAYNHIAQYEGTYNFEDLFITGNTPRAIQEDIYQKAFNDTIECFDSDNDGSLDIQEILDLYSASRVPIEVNSFNSEGIEIENPPRLDISNLERAINLCELEKIGVEPLN